MQLQVNDSNLYVDSQLPLIYCKTSSNDTQILGGRGWIHYKSHLSKYRYTTAPFDFGARVILPHEHIIINSIGR